MSKRVDESDLGKHKKIEDKRIIKKLKKNKTNTFVIQNAFSKRALV